MKPVRSKPPKKASHQKKTTSKGFTVVAIGASTGGLEAVSALLKNLPADTGMAFIYVQHLSPDHKSMLTEILSKTTEMKVQVIDDMELMKPNNVYVIPHNKGISVTDGHIKLLPYSKNSPAVSIDILFASLALTHKKNVMGVILSGNAKDGTVGLKAIKAAGGTTFAQDDSAQAGSMPRSAIAAGVVDHILSPQKIAIEIARLGKTGFKGGIAGHKREEDSAHSFEPDLKNILEILRADKSIDFSHYKTSTITRRVRHRMGQNNMHTMKEYGKYLLKKNKEADLLCQDLLINVTEFFRDTETFRYLKNTFFPNLLKSKKAGELLRIWVPACSTGQEVYSIAMLLAELQEGKIKRTPVKIFATDLCDPAIHSARTGKYSQSEIRSVPKKLLERFFTRSEDHYFIAKEIREMCVFAPHNILTDPPFFRIDFISCRNLLIYFDSVAQKKALTSMHFALNEEGCLLLGKSETTGASSQLFTSVNNKFKVYSRKKSSAMRVLPQLAPSIHKAVPKKNILPVTGKSTAVDSADLDSAIDSALLSHCMPACAIINKNMEILQFRGLTSMYLSHPSGGKANLNILKMMRPEFSVELRNAIHQAIKTKQPVRKPGIEIKIDSVFQLMTLEVYPLKIVWDEPLLLVVFTLQQQVEKYEESGKGKSIRPSIEKQKDRRIKTLTDALNKARAEMDTVIESQETAFEELQTASEEIVSTNEELQTLNEELETSKEEIQATNEELASTNQELQTHNELLTESYDLSEAIIATLHEPMLILDKDLRVKSANKSFYKSFRVKKEETEGMFLFELGNNQWNIPKLRRLLEDIHLKTSHFENFEITHDFPGIGKKTMLLNAHPIIQKAHSKLLILLAIADITEQNKEVKKQEILSKYSRSLIEASFDPLVTINIKGKITDMNEALMDVTGMTRAELTDSDFFDYFTESQKAREVYEEVFAKGSVANSPLTLRHKNGKLTDVLFNGSVYKDDRGNVLGVVVVARDISAQKAIEKELTEARNTAELASKTAESAQNRAEGATVAAEKATGAAENATRIAEDAVKAKQQFLSNMSHEIRTPMNAIIGFTKVVLKTDLTAKQKEYLSAIKMSGDALIVLINDILDLAKVDAGKMTFEAVPFKMATSVSAMIHLFETKIQEKNLELIKEYDPSIPKVLVGDPVRLHQIILNLISNAIKFTDKGKIKMGVRLVREDEEKADIEFSVTDTGIGIPEDKIKTVFEDFQQATSGTARLYGGTGLGLAIVKQLVESQGGTIAVKSKVNEGSTFSFILGFQKTKREIELEEEIPAVISKKNKGIKVLVVEDIALNQLLMKTLLEDFGFEQDIASNGKIAIEKATKKQYDVILMDLQMPEMNGFEATEYIRNTLNSMVPIIALTADVTTVDMAKCKAIGMNDYIAKPVDEKLLYSKIMGLVNKPDPAISSGNKKGETQSKKFKFIDLAYLLRHTKSDPELMAEMIRLYLAQTPPLVNAMKQAVKNKDWESLSAAVHKMIPSFAIMGIDKEYEMVAKKIQDYAHQNDQAGTRQVTEEITILVSELENVCTEACKELEEELNRIKKTQYERQK